MLIKNVFIEGPDCSGKTTVINTIHKETKYRYHMFDRSRMSQAIFNTMYQRFIPNSDILYRKEISDLSNLYIVLLPDIETVLKRYDLRGDEIHDKSGIENVYRAFKKHALSKSRYPNVIIVKDNKNSWKSVLNAIERYEEKQTYETVLEFVNAFKEKEVIGLKTSEYGPLSKLKIDKDCMQFKKEKKYYEDIQREFIEKFINEINGNNEYNRKENKSSRRFIFNSDTCISSIHAINRGNVIYFHVYMRSSNVIQIKHDYRFCKNLIAVFNNLINGNFGSKNRSYYLDFTFGSAHII